MTVPELKHFSDGGDVISDRQFYPCERFMELINEASTQSGYQIKEASTRRIWLKVRLFPLLSAAEAS